MSIDGYSAAALEDLRKAVLKRAKGLAKQDAETRHKLRIRAKRLRYGAEFFCLVYDDDDAAKRHRRFITALKPVQEALGGLNDIAHAGDIAMSVLGKRPQPALIFTAGELVGQLQQPGARLLTEAGDAVDDLKDAKRFWSKPEKGQAPPD